MSFVKAVWPEFIEGAHHRVIAQKFNDLATGKITRLIVNMPPRHTKSEFASYLLPAWMVGRNPKLKIIQATHTGELAVRFGRKAKTLIDSEDYKKILIQLLEKTVRLRDVGKLPKVVSILQLVLVVQSRAVVQTCLLLTIRTLSKTQCQLRRLITRMNGTHQDHVSVYNQEPR
jgi:hypothetical protein